MSDPRVRLHITPLNSELLPALLGPSSSRVAQNISYHTIQTVPDSTYGFVDLPVMDAERVKKKLNGAILKGKKIKVENARPAKRSLADVEKVTAESDPSQPVRKSKRSKREPNVLPGHELPLKRKVKRGWTESKAEKGRKIRQDEGKKTQAPSKYTDHEELLFRTKIPPHKEQIEVAEKRRHKKSKGGTETVHEYSKTTIVPSFLRSNSNAEVEHAAEYRDGEGWLDASGRVLEEESQKVSRKRKAARLGLEIDVTRAEALNKNGQQRPLSPPLSKPNSSMTSLSSGHSARSNDETSSVQKAHADDAEETSSSGTSSSSESSDADSEPESETTSVVNTVAAPHAEGASKSTDSKAAISVHPLEALFRKPKVPSHLSIVSNPVNDDADSPQTGSAVTPGSGKSKPSLELRTSFSFFDNSAEEGESSEDEESEEEVGIAPSPHANHVYSNLPPMPLTPFSSQDFRVRRIRSAAPTPDTGDIRKSTGYGSLILGEDDPDDVLSDGEEHQKTAKDSTTNEDKTKNLLGVPQSEFEKRFWDKRGENNRAWKARRRAVLKEKRQRENRARRPRTF